MNSSEGRTPKRALMIGCRAFSGIDSVAREEQIVPNVPDYDLVFISEPHITEKFLAVVDSDFFDGMKKALVQLLHSNGKMIVLASTRMGLKREAKYPEWVSNRDWCPITFGTPEESGRSIVNKWKMYPSYLQKMTEWEFYFTIPNDCLSRELTNFYGSTHNTAYRVPLDPYLENRYNRILAGRCHIEVRKERQRSNEWGNTWSEYPNDPDFTTGDIILLPLLQQASAEEALADILREEIGYSTASAEPDWSQEIVMPFVPNLMQQVAEAGDIITNEQTKIEDLMTQINDIRSYRRLLYGTGTELEDVFKKSLQKLGAIVTPAQYGQEEYIVEINGEKYLVEVKGVSKSISLTHLRQLNDYLLKYQEDTGDVCKGILFGNPWRNHPPDARGTEETPEFPDNVVQRAEQWGVSLVSSKAFFYALIKALEDASLSAQILTNITSADGIASLELEQ